MSQSHFNDHIALARNAAPKLEIDLSQCQSDLDNKIIST
jgi:hypothetical protein